MVGARYLLGGNGKRQFVQRFEGRRTVPIAVPILFGSGEVVGEPGEGVAAPGEVVVLVAAGPVWDPGPASCRICLWRHIVVGCRGRWLCVRRSPPGLGS